MLFIKFEKILSKKINIDLLDRMNVNYKDKQDIKCVKIPPYIKYPIEDVTVLYLLTIVVVMVISNALNKTNRKYILKLSKPG